MPAVSKGRLKNLLEEMNRNTRNKQIKQTTNAVEELRKRNTLLYIQQQISSFTFRIYHFLLQNAAKIVQLARLVTNFPKITSKLATSV